MKLGKKAANEILTEVQEQVQQRILQTMNANATTQKPEMTSQSRSQIKAVHLKPTLATEFVNQSVEPWNSRNTGIWKAVFSPDASMIAIASNDNVAKLWGIKNRNLLQIFDGHSPPVISVAFSPDGSKVLSISRDQTARLWDTQTGELVRTVISETGPMKSAVFSPDGPYVLTAGGGTVRLWELYTYSEFNFDSI